MAYSCDRVLLIVYFLSYILLFTQCYAYMKANSSLCALQNHFLSSKPKPHFITVYFLPPVPSFSATGAYLRLLPVHKLLIQSHFPKELGPQQAFMRKMSFLKRDLLPPPLISASLEL